MGASRREWALRAGVGRFAPGVGPFGPGVARWRAVAGQRMATARRALLPAPPQAWRDSPRPQPAHESATMPNASMTARATDAATVRPMSTAPKDLKLWQEAVGLAGE